MAANRGTGRRSTGRFGTRLELTGHVWAIQRQQVRPNWKAIALACGVTTQAVKMILEAREGLEDYLRRGCPTGTG